MRATADSRTTGRHEILPFHFQKHKKSMFPLIFSFRSAVPVQEIKLVPVFRLYASASFLCLQGTASPGAKWPKQHFILKVAGSTHVVHKPDGSGSPEA